MWENRNRWANRYLGGGALGSIRIGSAENWMREQVNSHDSMLILRDMKLVSIAYGELLLCQSEPRYIPTRSKTQSWMVCVQLSKRERVKVQHNIIFWCIQIKLVMRLPINKTKGYFQTIFFMKNSTFLPKYHLNLFPKSQFSSCINPCLVILFW